MEDTATNDSHTSSNKENYIPAIHGAQITQLQAKTEALEKKLRKYIAHSECLTKEKEAMKEMINETISELGGRNIADNDLSASVVTLCERLHTLEEECDSLNETKDALQNSVNQTRANLNEATIKKLEFKEELNISRQQVIDLNRKQKKLQNIAENVKGCTKDLEEEKNRQVSYLEKENLHILEENKKLTKEVRTLKTRSKAAALDIHDEPTEDLGSILSMTRSFNDKENRVNGSVNSPKPMVETLSKPRVGLGSGEGEIHDDNSQECNQS